MNFYITVAISAGIGTALVETLFKLFLEHWLKEKYYLFTTKMADRSECAGVLLEILNPVNNSEWDDIGNGIYKKASHLMDRLEALGEREFSEILARYTADQMMLRFMLKIQPQPSQANKLSQDLKETRERIESGRKDLIKVARKLKR